MILHRWNPPCFSRVFKIVFWAAVSGSVALAAGCASKTAIQKPSDPEPLPGQNFTRQWAVQVDPSNGTVERVYVRDNYLFAYTSTGIAYIFDRTDGRILTTVRVHHSTERMHGPVILKDRIIFPTSTTLEIYDRAGVFIRSKPLHYSIRTEAVGIGNLLFYGADYAGGGRVVEVDVDNVVLDHKWELEFWKASVSASPAVSGDTLYAAGENGDVVAVSVDNRSPLWGDLPDNTFHTYGAVVADLVTDEGNLYVASQDGKLVCLARNNARVRWQYIAGEPLRDKPVVTKDLVFQFVPNSGLAALSKSTGDFNRQPRWVAREVTQYLAEDDKYVYGRRQDNAIVALDKATGTPTFASRRTDYTSFAPNRVDGIVYAASAGGRVLAIKPVLSPGGIGEIVLYPIAQDAVAQAQ